MHVHIVGLYTLLSKQNTLPLKHEDAPKTLWSIAVIGDGPRASRNISPPNAPTFQCPCQQLHRSNVHGVAAASEEEVENDDRGSPWKRDGGQSTSPTNRETRGHGSVIMPLPPQLLAQIWEVI